MAKFKYAHVTHECDDETYAKLVTYIAECQIRRFNILNDVEDKVSEVVAVFWAKDLRKAYKTDKNCKFISFVTTCVARRLMPRKVKPFRTMDPLRYVTMRDEDRREVSARAYVDALRHKYGDLMVDQMLAYVTGRFIPGHDMHKSALKKLLAKDSLLKVLHEAQTWADAAPLLPNVD